MPTKSKQLAKQLSQRASVKDLLLFQVIVFNFPWNNSIKMQDFLLINLLPCQTFVQTKNF